MKKGLILVNAYTPSAAELNQPKRLQEELKGLGSETDLRRNDFFAARIDGTGSVSSCVEDYGYCIYFDKDKYIPRMLEARGLRLFNRAAAVEACDDKMLTCLALADSGIPVPETLAGLLCYYPNEPTRAETLKRVEALGYPLVVKECFGSLGKGVYLANNREELLEMIAKVKCKPHLFQKFIKESAGRDLRVIVVGGRAVGAMLRTGQDFRSNVGCGGGAEAAVLDGEARMIAEKAASTLKLDYCGVDLLYGKDGYVLCEVNSNAFFRTFERVTGINVARLYAEHIVKQITEGNG